MELKEGMYVRYKTLSNRIKIAKIIEIDKKVLDLNNKDCTNEKYIIGQPSFNVIDLIEVGDYVNGLKVIGKVLYGNNSGVEVFGDIYYIEDIKSIVTKEMFEQMKYEVE